MQRRHLAMGGAVVAVALGVAAWWSLTPRRLGLKDSRLVLVTGDATVDGKHVRAGQLLPTGATLVTASQGIACFSVRLSRVCLGTGTQAKLAELGEHAARIEGDRGAVVLRSFGDELRLVLPDGAVQVQNGAASVEISTGDVLVRALEGSASIQPAGHDPGVAPIVLPAPGCVGLRDGAKRPSSPQVEHEELAVTELARRWQGSAGAIIQYDGVHGRVEIDGDDLGRAPASVLLDEGEHTLVVHGGPHETTKETLHIKGGETVVRGNGT